MTRELPVRAQSTEGRRTGPRSGKQKWGPLLALPSRTSLANLTSLTLVIADNVVATTTSSQKTIPANAAEFPICGEPNEIEGS